MRTNQHPTEIASTILDRSVCAVKVGAVIEDRNGVFAWGWNSAGPDGMGQHAEAHALSRANRRRLVTATMWVAAMRKKNAHLVTAKPCEKCQKLLTLVGRVMFRNEKGKWEQQ